MSYHVGKDGQTEGPLSEDEITRRLADGRLGPDDLVWREGWAEWKPFHESAFTVPEIPPPAPNGAHPWRRYLARLTDINLFTISFGFCIGIFFPDLVDKVPDILFGIVGVICMIPAETLLLSLWGTTPGKWLMGIRVADTENKLLRWPGAFRRSLGVLVSGCGLGIPVVSLITLLAGYQTLARNERTSWDRACGSYLRFREIGIIRLGVAWVLWALVPALVAYERLASFNP